MAAKNRSRKAKPSGSAEPEGGRPKPKNAKRAGRWVWIARLLAAAVFAASAGLLAIVAVFSFYARDLPTVDALKKYQPPQTTRVLDREGRLIAELFKERRTVVPMARIPRVLVLSVLAAEDADFYRHQGLDYAGIARALVYDLLKGKAMQGASTITQQIVKNILLKPERTVARKIRELILARRLEQKLKKDQILYLYLNHINFGHGRYGVQEASRFYFEKNVNDLTLAEAALLAGIPQAPSRYSPLLHPEAARQRRRYVLDQLEQKRDRYWDDLPGAAIRAAREEPIKVVKREPPADPAPEVVTLARKALERQVGEAAAGLGGYTIETTIDLQVQELARRTLREGLMRIDQRQNLLGPLRVKRIGRGQLSRVNKLEVGRTYDARVTGADDRNGVIQLDIGGQPAWAPLAELARYNPRSLPASQFAPTGAVVRASVQALLGEKEPAQAKLELGPEGAMVVIDPRSRDVLALVGDEKAMFGFDRASSAVRQPGSAFKPIVYALALDSGRFTPATLVLDAPEVFDKWQPDNFETWHYEGAVRLREALAKSINLVAVRVIDEITPAAVVSFARKLGITTPLEPSLALALGASGVRPLELVNAYASFAAGGRWAPARIIKRIVDARGKALPEQPPEAPRAVIKRAAAYLVTSMLTSVVQEGTGKAASRLGRPAAGKTGTSNNSRDAWFVGYTPEIVAGVWVGYDDYRPLGKNENGPKSALPIWVDFIGAYTRGKPAVDFPVPSGVVTARIDPKSGLLAYEGMPDAIEEVFLDGTAPTETARPPDLLDSKSFLIEQLGGNQKPNQPPPVTSQ